MAEKIEVELDVYNRIHDWRMSLINAQRALELFDYFNEQLFVKKINEKCVPHDTAQSGFVLSLDLPAVYYMRLFTTGYGVNGKMSSNKSEGIESIRKDMISYVCAELGWSKYDWDQFHDSISRLRDQIVAHFDATGVQFNDDGRGFAYKHALMRPEGREKLRNVISLMKKFTSRFKIYDSK